MLLILIMWGQPPPAVRRAQPGWFWLLPRLMRKKSILTLFGVLALVSCSPRDYLTRRLATDLISASDAFKTPTQFALKSGIVSNREYVSPEYLILQQHGWISASTARCPPGMAPPPCWDVLLTPSGVETVQALLPADAASKPQILIPVARRELVRVTGISKQGATADLDFSSE